MIFISQSAKLWERLPLGSPHAESNGTTHHRQFICRSGHLPLHPRMLRIQLWLIGGAKDPVRQGRFGDADRAAQHVIHQHFNRGIAPAIRNAQGVSKAWISWRLGGDQCDYADEMPMVRKMFADELAQHGLTPRMDRAYAQKLADLPPLAKST
jgi:hypothetical protein